MRSESETGFVVIDSQHSGFQFAAFLLSSGFLGPEHSLAGELIKTGNGECKRTPRAEIE